MKRWILILTMGLVFFAGLKIGSYASGMSEPSQGKVDRDKLRKVKSNFQLGQEAEKAGDYKKAADYFKEAAKEDPLNPEVLNLLAHAQRKIGQLEEALANYKKALDLKPRFAEAREYLGEAYLQGALGQLEILKSYGPEGKEEWEDLSKAIKAAAAKL